MIQAGHLSAADRARSYTTRMGGRLSVALRGMRGTYGTHARLLDIGCGYGGLSARLGIMLGIPEIHGVDLDPRAVSAAREAGIEARVWDIRRLPMPYDDQTFDVITLLGVLNYVSPLDPLLREVYRLLRPGGHVVVTLPNLASWHTRLMLALGYQPRDLEVSAERLVGVHSRYRSAAPVGHIAGVTTKALSELMVHHGFEQQTLTAASPVLSNASWFVRLLDRLATRNPHLARRFIYVGRKAHRDTSDPVPGWWTSMQASVELDESGSGGQGESPST